MALALTLAVLIGRFRLKEVEVSRRATADRSVRYFRKLQPGNARKQRARLQTYALRMLQVTRIVERNAQFQLLSCGARLEFGQYLANVFALGRERPGPFRIFRFVPKQVAILLHVGSATRRVGDDCLDVRALECINPSFRHPSPPPSLSLTPQNSPPPTLPHRRTPFRPS